MPGNLAETTTGRIDYAFAMDAKGFCQPIYSGHRNGGAFILDQPKHAYTYADFIGHFLLRRKSIEIYPQLLDRFAVGRELFHGTLSHLLSTYTRIFRRGRQMSGIRAANNRHAGFVLSVRVAPRPDSAPPNAVGFCAQR